MPLKKIQKNKVRKTCYLCGRKRYIRDMQNVSIMSKEDGLYFICIDSKTCILIGRHKEELKKQKENELLKRSKYNS